MAAVIFLSNKNGSVYDLIIIGLGPAGCNAAIMMAEAGLKVAVVKRSESTRYRSSIPFGLAGLSTVRGRFDPLFEQFEGAIVRRDRLVFGHTDESNSVDDLVAKLAKKIGINKRYYTLTKRLKSLIIGGMS